MSIFSRVIAPVLIATLCFAGPTSARAQSAAAGSEQPSEETWNSIKGDIFKDHPILDGAGLVILDAPRRAEDAAVVPIGMRVNFTAGDKRTLQSLTLVIDENPAPVAGNVHDRPAFRRDIDFYTRPGQYLFLCARRCRTQRWPALWRQGLRESLRRLLRAGGGECRRHQVDARSDEIPHLPFGGRRAARGPDHAAPPPEFRSADGPVDAALRAAVFYREPEDLAGRRSSWWRWMAGSQYRKIRISASTISPTAPPIFAPKQPTPAKTGSRTSGLGAV